MVVFNNSKQKRENMFGLKKKDNTGSVEKQIGRPAKKFGIKQTYKAIAVTPEVHQAIKKLAKKRNSTMIDTVSSLVEI